MPAPALVVLVLFSLGAAACAVYWAVALARILHSLRTAPTLRDGLASASPSPAPTVCAIVPAHNEEDALPIVLEGLLAQDHGALSVVLALDRCTDGTPGVARGFAPRFARAGRTLEILEIGSCPEGWAGKVHALWRATRDSAGAPRADLLLFLDADTRPEPACVRAAVNLLHARAADMLSALSTLTSAEWFERIAQPAAALELLRQYPLDRANRAEGGRPFANGQFMLWRREAYERAGGHASVRAALLEDIALARRLFLVGGVQALALSGGLLSCRMYHGWREFRSGWKRIFIESANRRSPRLRSLGARMLATNVAMPALALGAIVAGAWAVSVYGWRDGAATITLALGAAGALLHLIAMTTSLRAQRAPILAAPFQPIGAWLVARILFEAGADLRAGRATAWGGLKYTIRDRGERPDTPQGNWFDDAESADLKSGSPPNAAML